MKLKRIIYIFGLLSFLGGIFISGKTNIGVFVGILGGIMMSISISKKEINTKQVMKNGMILSLGLTLYIYRNFNYDKIDYDPFLSIIVGIFMGNTLIEIIQNKSYPRKIDKRTIVVSLFYILFFGISTIVMINLLA